MSAEAAAREAIAWVRAHYDEDIFPPRPKGPHSEVYDSEFAACARLICANILREFERRLNEEEEAPEVEVSTDIVPIQPTAPTKIQRRSGAKNLSSAHLQAAFIDEARSAMGQPSQILVTTLVGKRVRLVFNDDTLPVTGTLTDVVSHPTSSYVVIDDDVHKMYPLNSLQGIEEA